MNDKCSTMKGNIRIRGDANLEELKSLFESVTLFLGCVSIENTTLRDVNFLSKVKDFTYMADVCKGNDHALRIVRNNFLESVKLHEKVIFDDESFTKRESFTAPFINYLPNDITSGYGLIIKGWTPENAKDFTIELYSRNLYERERALHINVRFKEGAIVMNAMEQGRWGKEHRTRCVVEKGQLFDIRIRILATRFDIYMDQEKLTSFDHRVSHTVISSAMVRGEVIYLERFYWTFPNNQTIYDHGKHLLLIQKNKELREDVIIPQWASSVFRSVVPVTLCTGGYVSDKFLDELDPNCTTIDGNLIISGLKSTPKDIDKLKQIKKITNGRLSITNNEKISNLSFISNLQDIYQESKIDAGLEIRSNKDLNLLGLSNLSTVEVQPEAVYSIMIEDNYDLRLSEQEKAKLESLGNGRAVINITEIEEITMASKSEGFPYVAVVAVVLLSLFPFTVGAIIVYLRLKKAKKEQENEHKRVKELTHELEINQRKMDRMEDEKRNQGKLLHHYATKHDEKETSEIVDEMLNSGQSARPFVS